MIEILVSLIIAGAATYFLYKNIKNRSKGSCNCGSCSSHCPEYDQNKK
ncbi:MAG TPA: FeoB-associated Cys-rich membrane protein [Clostridium sp.]|jgi:hypothetical protein|nr:FeoB-associated Cys-rich membrane protein [Clostridia bacterium]HCW03832.1 FeoB-associated Cys-rich membrane protein [Clostridium sp.]